MERVEDCWPFKISVRFSCIIMLFGFCIRMLAVTLVSDLFIYLFILSLLRFSPLSWYNGRSWLALTYQLFINGRSWLALVIYQLFIYLVGVFFFFFFVFVCLFVFLFLFSFFLSVVSLWQTYCIVSMTYMNILSVLQAYSHHHHYHYHYHHQQKQKTKKNNKNVNAWLSWKKTNHEIPSRNICRECVSTLEAYSY